MEQTLVRSIFRFRQLRAQLTVLRVELSQEDRRELESLERQLKAPPGSKGPGAEQREYFRFAARGAVEVEVLVAGGWQRAVLVDLGGGGFAVGQVAEVGRGSFIRLRMIESSLAHYEFPAQVVSSGDGRLGCAFVGTPQHRLVASPQQSSEPVPELTPTLADGTQKMLRINPDEAELRANEAGARAREASPPTAPLVPRHRGRCVVLVTSSLWGALLAEAGFEVAPVEAPDRAREILRRSNLPVAGFVVAHAEASAYAAAIGQLAPVLGVRPESALFSQPDTGPEVERLLAELDASAREQVRLRTLLERRASASARPAVHGPRR